jgi:hypothetical protein
MRQEIKEARARKKKVIAEYKEKERSKYKSEIIICSMADFGVKFINWQMANNSRYLPEKQRYDHKCIHEIVHNGREHTIYYW